MKKKKVLILGANPETVSLILKAKEMGLYTIVTDNNPHAYAKRFADQPENVNAVDVEGLTKLAEKEQVDGVIVGVAEALLPAYCKVCRNLGLPAYSTEEVFSVMVRKDFFKEKCREYGVPTIREFDPEKPEEIIYPVIVKPVDSCSSKGIRICHNRQELDQAAEYALSFSNTGRYLIEEYMTGDEVISYYVMQDGNPVFAGMCDRYTYKPKGDLVQLPTSYVFPSRYIDSYLEHSDAAVKRMIRGLELKQGSIFFQCFVDDEGIVRTYEPGYRLNGAQEHLILSKVSGIDAKEIYINYALSGKVSDYDLAAAANPKHEELCCKLSPLVRLGRISKIDGLKEIEALSDVVSVNPSYTDGEEVTGEGTLKQIVCRFFIVSKTKEALADTVDEIERLLKVYDENGENMLIGEFDSDVIRRNY